MATLIQTILLAVALGSPGADAGNDADLSSAVASIIAYNGFLCAQVVDVRAIDSNHFEVTCTERAGNPKTVRYIMNLDDGTAVKA